MRNVLVVATGTPVAFMVGLAANRYGEPALWVLSAFIAVVVIYTLYRAITGKS